MVKKIYIGLFFWLLSLSLTSQNLISYITVNSDKAYIGQPIQLKVSVYTTTWFTKGVDVGNIQVDGALTVYFRSVSNTKIFGKTKYAGVDFFYNLFPTKEGTIIIPELEIQLVSPKEGDYKGIKHTVRTKIKRITVKGIPLGYDPNEWLVASSLNITEKWAQNLKDVKVGDVVQRTIIRSAGGTLSEFIPASQWDSVKGLSIYPKRAKLQTNKSKTGVSSQRAETVNYLFEKEGEITLPTIKYLYWNLINKKFYIKQIDSITIKVMPNADLAMLASLKKSLQKEIKADVKEENKKFLIFGMSPLDFIKYIIFALIALLIIFQLSKVLFNLYKKILSKYLISEVFIFKQVKKSILQKDFYAFIKTSKIWLRKLEILNSSMTLFIKVYGTKNLNKVYLELNEMYFKEDSKNKNYNFEHLLKELEDSRKNYLTQQKLKIRNSKKNKVWLNPTEND